MRSCSPEQSSRAHRPAAVSRQEREQGRPRAAALAEPPRAGSANKTFPQRRSNGHPHASLEPLRLHEFPAASEARYLSASLGTANQGKKSSGLSNPLAMRRASAGYACADPMMLSTWGGGGCSSALVQPVTNWA